MDHTSFKHNVFYYSAYHALIDSKKIIDDFESKHSSININLQLDKDLKHNYLVSQAEMYDHLEVLKNNAIIYSAIFLESFINFYGLKNKIQYRKEFEEKLSIKHKWIIYPQLTHTKKIKDNIIQKIDKIVKDRNYLVHYKAKKIIDFGLSLADSFNNFNDLKLIYFSICEIDTKFSKDYFNLECEMPLNAKNIKSVHACEC